MPPSPSPEVRAAFDAAPAPLKAGFLRLRGLILDVANADERIGALTETLKWGQPSWLARSGSTVRLGWAKDDERHCRVYFHCRTPLVSIFRERYADVLDFEGERAIVVAPDRNDLDPILRECIGLALTWHRVKQHYRMRA